MNSKVTKLKNANAPNNNDPNDPAWEPVRKQIQELLDNKVISARKLSQESGNNETGVNQFLNYKYTGRNDRINERLQTWLDTHKRRMEAEKEIPDGPGFVLTKTAIKIEETLTYAHMAKDIALVFGISGVGKTETFREYVRNNSGVCLATMTPSHVTVAKSLREIGKCLGIGPMRDNAALYDAVSDALMGTNGLLIIDEAQHLGTAALDQIRQIHDRAGCGIVFAGNEQVYTNLTGSRRAEYLAPLFSRCGMRTRLKASMAVDARTLGNAWGIEDATSLKLVVDIAKKPGGLRLITKTLKLAHMLAVNKEGLEPKHIRAAWHRLGGDQ